MKRLALFVVFMLAPNLVFAASFDCGKTLTRVEKLICGSEEISKLDSALGNAYTYVLGNTHAKGKRSTLIADQKNWITSIRDGCNNVDCLLHAYLTRIDVLTIIKTDKSTARYVVDQNRRSAETAKFQSDLKQVGITGTLSECNRMVELIDQQGGRDESYGAICKLNGKSIMICNDTMIGKLTVTFGFGMDGASIADFTETNCPCGG